jgi:hypothetical protein
MVESQGQPLDPYRADFARDRDAYGTLADIVDKIKTNSYPVINEREKEENDNENQTDLTTRKTEDGKSDLNSTKFIEEHSTSTRRILSVKESDEKLGSRTFDKSESGQISNYKQGLSPNFA